MPNTSFILFLNKTDVYDKKVQHSKIENHFPDYAGFQNDGNDGKAFILRKFMDLKTKDSFIYAHYTQATDTENIRVVFDVVRDNVLQMHLRYYLLVS
ncbi:guanine nucleotide-binding protein G(q) subunit alpha isoform X1 [Eurytemora carolleeae]|uniref:guanine nucleotide-binding protein G(q) subunit alpha isoform X1 n=1 Tax=Eurytemora carolleeae TaxID=1294199 RepID=UPI000C767ABC|nr:guanine nucleotide-binding protein G(q) subunit alpha isoform X1 [Eurytemora carolleeae]|eukprot:XP_023345041.1 guanine nucleotide-binding protein G(q) subunit alpha-like isoform X1 [Eurytemora affinis]